MAFRINLIDKYAWTKNKFGQGISFNSKIRMINKWIRHT
jgi:hypothetical protein